MSTPNCNDNRIGSTSLHNNRVNMLVDMMFELSDIEMFSFLQKMNEAEENHKILSSTNVSRMYLLGHEVTAEQKVDVLGDAYREESDELAQFLSDPKVIDIIGLSSGQAGGSAKTEVVEQKEVKVEVKEKTAFDVELTSFSPDGKIKAIKEVKDMFKLGLKEAKDMVERSPVVLQSNVTKEEAEAIKSKLGAIGCVITIK